MTDRLPPNAPRGICPYCGSRISTVVRDGMAYARCSHRGCGARGPLHRSESRACELFAYMRRDARLGAMVRRSISGMDPESKIERLETIARDSGPDTWEHDVLLAVANALREETEK